MMIGISVNERWPVYTLAPVLTADEVVGATESDLLRWAAVLAEYQQVQDELRRLYERAADFHGQVL